MACRTANRPAFTLLEILLVLAILVLAAGLAVVSFSGMSPYYKVNGGVDSVRAAWAHARAKAIEQGVPYRFSVEPDGSFFRVAPDDERFWSGGGGGSDTGSGPPYIHEEALPHGVRFIVNGDPEPNPAAAPPEDPNKKPSGRWSTVCVFNCDGTAREDVRIVFQIRGAAPIAVYLRGLTGAVAVVNLPPMK